MDAYRKRARELERDMGCLLPSDIVEDGKNPDSPLHSYFEWDNDVCGERYRLDQARTLIRSIRVEVTIRDIPLSVVGYVRDPDKETRDGGYRNVLTLRSDEDSARAAIVDEMKRVSNAVKRAKTLAIVLGVSDQLEIIERMAASVSTHIESNP